MAKIIKNQILPSGQGQGQGHGQGHIKRKNFRSFQIRHKK